MDRTLSGATTLDQSGPGRNGNEGILRIPQSSSITRISSSDCLMSTQDIRWGGGLTICIEAVRVFYSSSRLGNLKLEMKGNISKVLNNVNL